MILYDINKYMYDICIYIYTQDGGFAILKWEICCKLTTDSFLPFCSPKRLATRCGLSWTSQCVFLKQSWGIMRWHFEDPTPHNPHSVRDVGHLPRSTADMRKRKWTSCIVASHLSESVRHTYLKLTSPSHPTPPHPIVYRRRTHCAAGIYTGIFKMGIWILTDGFFSWVFTLLSWENTAHIFCFKNA